MSTLPLAVWDVPEERAKVRGQARGASAHYRDLELAREIAKEIAKDGRVISADDVREAMTARFPDTVYGNWCGAIWDRKVFRPVGFGLEVDAGG